MSLAVLNVAYPFSAVGRDSIGGAEQVLNAIDKAMVEAGHHSFVLATDDSKISGTLIDVPAWDEPITNSMRKHVYAYLRRAIAQALEERQIDVLHLHGVDFENYLPKTTAPIVATLHLPLYYYRANLLGTLDDQIMVTCVSKTQMRDVIPFRAARLIENGVDTNKLPRAVPRGSFALALGRICPEKGFHIALDAAARAGVELRLAGYVFPYAAHQVYFEQEIAPRLDSRRRFVGPAGWEAKCRLLSAARCVLIPSLIAETSSLVAMEALSCGTPVIAFPSGALADIVEHGTTGFLVNDADEMARAIKWSESIDRRRCRARATRRFSESRMVAQYVELYESLASNNQASHPSPDGHDPAARSRPHA